MKIFIKKPKFKKLKDDDSLAEMRQKVNYNRRKSLEYRAAKRSRIPKFIRRRIEANIWKEGLRILKVYSDGWSRNKILLKRIHAVRSAFHPFCLEINNKEILAEQI